MSSVLINRKTRQLLVFRFLLLSLNGIPPTSMFIRNNLTWGLSNVVSQQFELKSAYNKQYLCLFYVTNSSDKLSKLLRFSRSIFLSLSRSRCLVIHSVAAKQKKPQKTSNRISLERTKGDHLQISISYCCLPRSLFRKNKQKTKKHQLCRGSISRGKTQTATWKAAHCAT